MGDNRGMNDRRPPFPPFPPLPPFVAEGLQGLMQAVQPPDWLVAELQNRVVLFLNHVLQQESAATERLRRQQGKVVRVNWGVFELLLSPSPAGLLQRCAPTTPADLSMTLTDASPFALAQALLAGDKPKVDIQGDVLLAAELAWLVDNVRWDVEEDLSRWVGDAPAHALVGQARTASGALREFLGRVGGQRPPERP